jgi:3',5'-cyclic-nucleotide phosphodiesterase
VLVRKIVIELVLATDMAKHFDFLGNFRAKLKSGASMAETVCDVEERIYLMKIIIKCSDIGHAAKIQEIHEKWSAKVCEEFFTQGDMEKERGLPISMYCDRDSTDIAKSQAGFIANLVLPLFDCVH